MSLVNSTTSRDRGLGQGDYLFYLFILFYCFSVVFYSFSYLAPISLFAAIIALISETRLDSEEVNTGYKGEFSYFSLNILSTFT